MRQFSFESGMPAVGNGTEWDKMGIDGTNFVLFIPAIYPATGPRSPGPAHVARLDYLLLTPLRKERLTRK